MANIEGTFCMEGLLEGPWRQGSDGEMASWLKQADAGGIKFHGQTNGGSFSIIPEPGVYAVPEKVDLGQRMEGVLNSFLERLPEEEAAASFSTIRSMEYKANEEVQSIYAIGPNGRIQTQQRSVSATTIAPSQPLTGRQVAIRAVMAGIVVGVLVLASTPFVPYRKLFDRAKSNVIPVKSEELKVELGPFEGSLSVDKVEVKDNAVTITLDLSERLKSSDDALSAAWKESTELREKLVLEALFKKRLVCKCFDAEATVIAKYTAELKPEKETFILKVPIQGGVRKVKLCL